MEKVVKIRTKGGFIIQGILTLASKKAVGKLVIFVHGLTGFKNEHIFYNGAAFFAKKGFDVFRFDLYPGGKGSRKLSRSTLKTHALDLNRVVKHFGKYKKIFIVGHSLGGLTVLFADLKNISGIVLWDPSCNLKNELLGLADYCRYNKALKAFIMNWGVEVVIGREMYEEWKHVPHPKDLMRGINVPVEIINAGKGVLKKAGREYFKWAKRPKKLLVINNAGHTFDEEGAEKKLLEGTLDWIRRF